MSGSTLPPQNEIDVQASTSVLVCFDNAGVFTQAYVRDLLTIDNATGAISSVVTQYSVDGLIWSVTPPLGTPTVGGCDGTKLLAVERFFYPSGSLIPATHLAYWIGDTVENTYGIPGLNATNVFIHHYQRDYGQHHQRDGKRR
jgi:hypothetical protein